jgi:hypothetical protein
MRDLFRLIIDRHRPFTRPKEWQAAMEALILVTTFGGPTMFARIGMLRALNHGKPNPATAAARQAR